ncbi:MAG: hypothetical protein ACW99G_05030 [Candidatus Thorarchaeota archaeon]|jgi:hypothetical protein
MIKCETCPTSYRACNDCPFKVKDGVTYATRILADELMTHFDSAWKEMADA